MGFYDDLEFSMGSRKQADCEMIKAAIPHCVDVRKTDIKDDKAGIDYVATLDHGAEINIDAKTRRKGVKKPNGFPELAIESWSDKPTVDRNGNKTPGKPGWTFSRSTNVDMILYSFDPTDWNKFYLVPFQHLRMAAIKNYWRWRENYRCSEQYNDSWISECIFVPADVVLEAVKNTMFMEQEDKE